MARLPIVHDRTLRLPLNAYNILLHELSQAHTCTAATDHLRDAAQNGFTVSDGALSCRAGLCRVPAARNAGLADDLHGRRVGPFRL